MNCPSVLYLSLFYSHSTSIVVILRICVYVMYVDDILPTQVISVFLNFLSLCTYTSIWFLSLSHFFHFEYPIVDKKYIRLFVCDSIIVYVLLLQRRLYLDFFK